MDSTVAIARRPLPRIAGSAPLPTALLAVIAAADLALRRWDFAVLPSGLIDWTGHLSTAALVFLAVAGAPWLLARPRLALTALAGSVLIDLDHVALYAGLPVDVGGGRPFTHSLATPLLFGTAWLLTGRRSTVLGGLAIGVLLHFVRDIGTGPGVPLWWPIRDTNVLLDYRWYAAAMVGVAAVATIRSVSRRSASGYSGTV